VEQGVGYRKKKIRPKNRRTILASKTKKKGLERENSRISSMRSLILGDKVTLVKQQNERKGVNTLAVASTSLVPIPIESRA